MKMMLCGQCKHVQSLNMKISYLEEGVERVYLVCDGCGVETTCYYGDAEIRAVQEEQRLLVSKPETKNWEKKVQKNRRKIKRLMDALKSRMESV